MAVIWNNVFSLNYIIFRGRRSNSVWHVWGTHFCRCDSLSISKLTRNTLPAQEETFPLRGGVLGKPVSEQGSPPHGSQTQVLSFDTFRYQSWGWLERLQLIYQIFCVVLFLFFSNTAWHRCVWLPGHQVWEEGHLVDERQKRKGALISDSDFKYFLAFPLVFLGEENLTACEVSWLKRGKYYSQSLDLIGELFHLPLSHTINECSNQWR